MPRTARLDAPGVLHHVMIRGIEKTKIFTGNKDREDFIERLANLCPAMGIILNERPTLLTYLHKDHLGSSTVMTNDSGFETESTQYMPYGSARPGSEEMTGTSYNFTDQEYDTENGLYNYDARLYDPVIGRFISPDTIVPKMFNPQSLNRYSYCLNNPLVYVDPSGHDEIIPGSTLVYVTTHIEGDTLVITRYWYYAPSGYDWMWNFIMFITMGRGIAYANEEENSPETGEEAPEQEVTERPLTEDEKNYLSPFIREEDLNEARLHIGEVPWYLGEEYDGITRGNDIYFRSRVENYDYITWLALLGHELVHVGQYEREGLTGIGWLWSCSNNPTGCRWETPAYEMQRNIYEELSGWGLFY
jgi:RHS repeat-associated protein